MEYDQLLRSLNDNPDDIEYNDVVELIDDMYEFTPVRFTNGDLINEPGQNSGSCKIFAFAKRTRLSEQQTLHCFGAFYRDDVLKHPDNMDHQNIRNFMKTGWGGIEIEGAPLSLKD
ncbi:MAG: HopJ type III effector protein [Thiotrichales bacterium]|nr:MAG: HopJ type III effector protein [Thiotrichales bacterium]